MNIEEIKMITEMITSLGSTGKEAFIWWLLMKKGLDFIANIAFFITVYCCVKVALNQLPHTRIIKDIYHQVMDTPISCDFFGANDIDRLKTRIQELKDKANASKN